MPSGVLNGDSCKQYEYKNYTFQERYHLPKVVTSVERKKFLIDQ